VRNVEQAGRIGRRTLLGGGLASVVGVGTAGCTSQPATIPPTAGGVTEQPTSSTSTPTSVGAPAILHTRGEDVVHGPRDGSAVALTFHGAGEPTVTQEVLRICATYRAQITVFAVGTWLTAHPDLGRAIVAGGHDLGNHTWSHQPMLRLGASAADAEVRDGARAVAAIKGGSPILFRPSGTARSTPLIRAAAEAAGYARCVSYDVDSLDYTDPGSAAVVRHTLAGMRPGSIISLHLGHVGTVEALPTILRGLAERSLRAVSVTKLLS